MSRPTAVRHVAPAALAALALGCAATAAAALDHAEQTPQAILASTPAASGVFAADDRGGLVHLQSGLHCPAKFGRLPLYKVLVYKGVRQAGDDVGCDYAPAQSTDSKLTVFVTRAADGDTLDAAFHRYQAEVAQVRPGQKLLGPAVEFKGAAAKPDQPGPETVRSEEYELTLDGRRYQSDLIVAVRKGWVLEVRGTYPMEVASAEEAADLAGPAVAFFAAFEDLK